MIVEIKVLETNQTWEIIYLSKEKKAIVSKWVYKVKLKPDVSIDCHKARLVTKRYRQNAEVDYFDSFSLVSKNVIIRLFLAIATSKCWLVEQLKIHNSFLHDYLKRKVYIKVPDGYVVPTNKVCRLYRSLYRLKQVGRE